jgi:hypothetical protein
VKDGTAGIRLADAPSDAANEVWLPLDRIDEAKLVLTDALVRAALKGAEAEADAERTLT